MFHVFIAASLLSLWIRTTPVHSFELTDFYDNVDKVVDINSHSPRQLCRQKWERINDMYGRGKKDLYYKWNGLHNKSILLVHVGKTAGASVKAQFETDGLDFEQVHLHSVDEAMIRAHAVVLVSLRDPVQRLVSAFNFRSPAAGVPLDPVCPLEQHKPFYDCFKSLDEYANALTDQSACGRIARRGECHTEFDTCAYLGGVMQELERNRHKVFVLDKATVLADLNRISNHLRWKIKFNKLPRIHEYSKSPNMTQISIVGMMKLTGFLAATGETAIYQKLSTDFRLPP